MTQCLPEDTLKKSEQLRLSRKAGLNDMKYSEEMYIDSQIFAGDMDGSESNFEEEIVDQVVGGGE